MNAANRWMLHGQLPLLCMAALSPAVQAQTAAGAQPAALEEVLVTAQKRVQRQQDTPISMTVLSGEALAERSMSNLADIQTITPGLVASTAAGNSQFGISFAVRGVSAIGSHESPVGVYVDDVYVASQSSYGSNGVGLTGLIDTARIEVLKGPQGTLYGRNTAAGAVNIHSNLPTESFEGLAGGSWGKDGYQNYTGVVSGPLLGEVRGRLAMEYGRSDGFQEVTSGGDDFGSYEQFGTRGTLLFEPSDEWTVTLRGNYGTADGPGRAVQIIAFEPNSAMVAEALVEEGLPETDEGMDAARSLLDAYVGGTRPSLAAVSPTGPNKSTFDTFGGSVTAQYSPRDSLTLKSVTAYLEQEAETNNDYDLTPYVGITAHLLAKVEQFTQELTLSGTVLDDKLTYAIGAYYFDMDKSDDAIAQAVSAINPESPNYSLIDIGTSSVSAYGQATYAVTDQLNATVGLRYTDEEKTLRTRNHSAATCLVPEEDWIDGRCAAKYDTSFDDVSWLAGIDYRVAPEVMVYAKVATGFRAGGTSEGSDIPGSYRNYDPEKITTYEAGIKSELLESRLRLNLSYYHSDYKDLQLPVNEVIPPSSIIISGIQNAGKAKIDGVEFEGLAEPWPNLLVSVTVGYIHPRFIEFSDADGDHTDREFPDVPEWTYSVSAAYTIPLDGAELSVRGDWSWRDEADLAPFDDATPTAFHTQDAYGLLNARLALSVEKWDADFALWGKNLNDKRYFSDITSQWSSIGYVLAGVGDPRSFGLEITKRF